MRGIQLRRDSKKGMRFMLMPLVDVIFLLLTFFMLSSKLAPYSALTLGDYRLEAAVSTAVGGWALWLLWALYRGLRAFLRVLLGTGWSRWSGQYFEFDGRQIRIVFDGDDVFFAAADVFDALGTSGLARDPEPSAE